MSRPLAIDLYCGLGGWTDGLLAEGYRVVGFDIEQHVYGAQRYPGQLVIQDVLTIHGRQFKDAALIVASPPCQKFSYMAMPWSKAKQQIRDYESGVRDVTQLTALFDACFRIQREASEAAGHHIPLVVENVRGAQRWVGRSAWAFGSFHLWGDVPALMPVAKIRAGRKNPGFRFDGSGRSMQSESVDRHIKNTGGSWFNIAHNTTSGTGRNPDGRKTTGHLNRRDGHSHTRHMTNPQEHNGIKVSGDWFGSYAEQKAAGTISPGRLHGKGSTARKAASALIAKIPLVLASWIAKSYLPIDQRSRSDR